MSEDIATRDTDLAGDRQGLSGIYQLGEAGEHYDLDHGVTLICDSHRNPIRRLAVRIGDTKRRERKRIPCPECGRTVTVYVRKGGQNVRLQAGLQRGA